MDKCETDHSIPRPPEWYAKEPFDASVVAFWDDEGVAHYFMHSPLDETYAAEPGDMYSPGSIPPEEREVRDTLLVAIIFRKRVSWIDFWWSQFFRPTQAYLVSLENLQKLGELCARSREHRAAFCRLSKCMSLHPAIPGLSMELKRIVDMADKQTHR